MFIRPIGSVVNPSQRPSGHPLLRGILARGAYVWDTAQRGAATPQPQTGTGPGPAAGARGDSGPAAAATATAPAPAAAAAAATASSAAREPAAVRPAARADSGAPGPGSPGADLTDRLTQLAALAREGLLTPEEFSAAKARLLAG